MSILKKHEKDYMDFINAGNIVLKIIKLPGKVIKVAVKLTTTILLQGAGASRHGPLKVHEGHGT